MIIKIFRSEKEMPDHTLATQKDGSFKIGPLDGSIEYRYRCMHDLLFFQVLIDACLKLRRAGLNRANRQSI